MSNQQNNTGNFDLAFRPKSLQKRPYEPDVDLYKQDRENAQRIKTLKKHTKPKSTFTEESVSLLFKSS